MTFFENLTTTQKIRATLHRDVRTICTETCHFLGLEMSKPAIEIVAELVYKKISLYGTDLEAFAKHSKRSTINSEDVKLLARRNTSLKEHLTNSSGLKEKRRKTAPSELKETTDKRKSIESTKDTGVLKNVGKTTPTEKTAEEVTTKSSKSSLGNVEEEIVLAKSVEQLINDNHDVGHNEDLEDMLVDNVIDLTFD